MMDAIGCYPMEIISALSKFFESAVSKGQDYTMETIDVSQIRGQ